MKKLILGLIATVFISTGCFAQSKATIESIESQEEFNKLSESDQKLVNYLDAAIASLKGMNLNGNTKQHYVASISIDLKNSKLSNNIIVSEVSEPTQTDSAQSCTFCSTLAGRVCYKKIQTRLQNGTVVVTVEQVGDCIKLSWD
ncbi:hypothetical protein KIH23_02230 [Flavobacterium sp. CYK-55]|uniref:hypothetical protein n=1 Tax=Flavobacterium sp. CYK-55 TaxID=2835529 RepID=UPI001BCDDD8B|nr:hypothetical protein [Flavobacterium sp. CYK-55]MBS7786101.1 hypothetical protein [Flavobacterium sp. CYK-55]